MIIFEGMVDVVEGYVGAIADEGQVFSVCFRLVVLRLVVLLLDRGRHADIDGSDAVRGLGWGGECPGFRVDAFEVDASVLTAGPVRVIQVRHELLVEHRPNAQNGAFTVRVGHGTGGLWPVHQAKPAFECLGSGFKKSGLLRRQEAMVPVSAEDFLCKDIRQLGPRRRVVDVLRAEVRRHAQKNMCRMEDGWKDRWEQ